MDAEEINLKKREQIFSFLKFFLGTFILGAAAALSTHFLKEGELKLKISEAEQSNNKDFVDRYMQYLDKKNRQSFVLFMSKVSAISEERTRYADLYNYLDSLYTIEELESNRIDSLKSLNEKIFERFNDVAMTLETAALSSEEREQKEEEYNELKNNDVIKTALQSQKVVQDIAQSTNLSPATQIQNEVQENVSSRFTNKWLKQGYYNPYGDYYLAVLNLDPKSQIVTFQLRKSRNLDESIIGENFILKPGGKQAFEDPSTNRIIVVYLNSIDAAGRNPLTKAAYFDLLIKHKNAYSP
ncbi:hypothetical protein [Marinoscillum sp. MHG1-6]|uniref:hypothetical protein n=1 Tax=Marinoscillum sp. MHG1-6 TaxID=2959627 RepID=UPI0021576623|nr:hypothetical protein [Marinoscillum sp. MHG1-6]